MDSYKNFCVYFTHLPGSPPWRDLHEILPEGSTRRHNQPCQILFQSDQGFWFCGGSNFWLSHKKEKSPLTQGLNYRSACDEYSLRRLLFGFFPDFLKLVSRGRLACCWRCKLRLRLISVRVFGDSAKLIVIAQFPAARCLVARLLIKLLVTIADYPILNHTVVGAVLGIKWQQQKHK